MSCEGFVGIILGHDFQPVFQVEKTGCGKLPEFVTERDLTALELQRATRTTYICSTCTRCGETTGE